MALTKAIKLKINKPEGKVLAQIKCPKCAKILGWDLFGIKVYCPECKHWVITS